MASEQPSDPRIEKAREMVSALCRRERMWVLSIPANPERDPDIIITDGLCAGREALARVAELERDRKWLDAFTVGRAHDSCDHGDCEACMSEQIRLRFGFDTEEGPTDDR